MAELSRLKNVNGVNVEMDGAEYDALKASSDAHDPELPENANRRALIDANAERSKIYNTEGATVEEIVLALIDDSEGRPEKLDEMKTARARARSRDHFPDLPT